MLLAAYPDVRIPECTERDAMQVEAPADFDWKLAGKLVSRKTRYWLKIYLLDDVAANLGALEAVRPRADSQRADSQQADSQRAEGDTPQVEGPWAAKQKAWQSFVAKDSGTSGDSYAHLEHALLRTLDDLLAERASAFDPRLAELERISTAVKSLWRRRLGEPALSAWLARPVAEPFVYDGTAPAAFATRLQLGRKWVIAEVRGELKQGAGASRPNFSGVASA
ncbi:MAG: hypothetical protein AB8H80_20055 [Planctomycetota bacterium]